MKLVSTISIMALLMTLPNTIHPSSAKPLTFVSLGRDCETGFVLRDLGLRNHAYPFDWIITPNFEAICLLIEDKFQHFLTLDYLKLDGRRIVNTYYDIAFYHDFPRQGVTPDLHTEFQDSSKLIVENYVDYLDDVTKKYTRRIERLVQLFDGSSKVVLVRTHINPTQAQRFVAIMAKHYPCADYMLLVAHSQKDLDYYWDIPHVASVYMQEIDEEPWRAAIQWFERKSWKKVFTEFGCIKPTP